MSSQPPGLLEPNRGDVAAARTFRDIVRKIEDTDRRLRHGTAQDVHGQQRPTRTPKSAHAPDKAHPDAFEEAGRSAGLGSLERFRGQALEPAGNAGDERRRAGRYTVKRVFRPVSELANSTLALILLVQCRGRESCDADEPLA